MRRNAAEGYYLRHLVRVLLVCFVGGVGSIVTSICLGVGWGLAGMVITTAATVALIMRLEDKVG